MQHYNHSKKKSGTTVVLSVFYGGSAPILSRVSLFLNFKFLGETFALCYTLMLAKIRLSSSEVF